MAFRQIKSIRQEEGKGYVFPDLSLVLGGEFNAIGFSEDFKEVIGISISTQISKLENFIEFSSTLSDNVGVTITPIIVQSKDFAPILSDNIGISITPNIVKSTDFASTLSDNLSISINTSITKTIDNISLSEISTDNINISINTNIVKEEEASQSGGGGGGSTSPSQEQEFAPA